MRFIDICAGIGGFRLGLERAGHKCIGFVEKDKFAVKSYKAMYDTEGEWYRDDITKIRTNDIPDADCWCFGFPCQDISVAGKQRGLDGARSGIYFDIIKLLKGKKEEDRPEWLLIENVKNLLSIDSGWGFSRVLSELDKAGYDAEWQVLNSKDFGVPQNRERVYIVGHLRSRGRRKILPVTGENNAVIRKVGMIPGRGENGIVYDTSGIVGTIKATESKGPKLIKVIDGAQAERVYSPEGLSVALSNASGGLGSATGLYFVDLKTEGKIKLTENARTIQARYHKGMSKRYGENSGVLEYRAIASPDMANKKQNGRRAKEAEEPMFTLTGRDRHGIIEAVGGIDVGQSSDFQHGILKGLARCLRASKPCGAVVLKNKAYKRIRRLTPRECFRLQGFQDDLFEKAAAVNSDTQLYKQAGNAVTVNVVYAIGKKIMEVKE